MATRKKKIQIRKFTGPFAAPTLSDAVAHYVKGDWAVTDREGLPYSSRRDYNYWLTHIPTGLGCGRFVTQKTAIAACKEVADLPCSATIGDNGKQKWTNYGAEGPAIAAVLKKWADSEKEAA